MLGDRTIAVHLDWAGATWKLLLAALLVLAPSESLAKFIALAPRVALGARVVDQTATLSGTYVVQNRGDELAKDVFVAFELGDWAFATDKVSLEKGAEHAWQLDESFPLDRLACSTDGSDLCAGQTLPQEGVLPLRITRYYQDANSYAFSGVTVLPLMIGNPTPEQRFAAEVSSLRSTLALEVKSDADISGTLEIQNLTDNAYTVSVGLMLPRELTTSTFPFQLELEPRGVQTAPIEITNHAALVGSTYEVFAILQWNDRGMRNTNPVPALVLLEEPDWSGQFLTTLITSVVVLLVAVGFLVFRRPKKSGEAPPEQAFTNGDRGE